MITVLDRAPLPLLWYEEQPRPNRLRLCLSTHKKGKTDETSQVRSGQYCFANKVATAFFIFFLYPDLAHALCPSEYGTSCNDICTYDSKGDDNIAECDLAEHGYVPGATESPQLYACTPDSVDDFRAYGYDGNGDPFCCENNDFGLTILYVKGTDPAEDDTALVRDTIDLICGAIDLICSSTYIYGYSANDTLKGSTYQDCTDYIHGGDDNDTIGGRDGDDYLYGEDANDEIRGDEGNDYIEGGAGVDTINGNAHNDTIYGEWAGLDYEIGGNHEDYILGGTGNDILYGQEDGDFLCRGEGTDYHYGGSTGDDNDNCENENMDDCEDNTAICTP